MALGETARLIASLELDGRKFDQGVGRALGSVGRLEGGIGRMGKGLGQIGGGLARAGAIIGTAVVGGIGAATKAAIDWEDAFTGVRKTVDATATTSLEQLDRGLRDMATTMPVTAADLALIAENAGAMGIKADDILMFTDTVAKLGATTDVSVDQASMALGQLQNVIGLTSDEFDNFGNTLVDLGNKGNSTESAILEIARRAGGSAKLFGIAKEQTLGWAAAAANLGMNQELAGTALQKVFLTALPKFMSGNKQLQDVTGLTAKQLKKAYEEDAGGALELLFQKLHDLPKEARLDAAGDIFGNTSGITRLVLGLADSVDQNLTPALDQSVAAWEANAAMEEEFAKRNATVRSAITRLKNNVRDAAIEFGQGLAPSIGRAADKLSAFLKEGDNRSQIRRMGEDIGKAIDGIDWKKVLDGAKTFVGVLKDALGFAKLIFDAFNTLPTEVKGGALGLVGLNKLSGGLLGQGIGNLIGGLTSGLGSALVKAGIGKAFVQPVFVTNMGVGGMGGAAGAAGAAKGGLGLVSKVFLVGEAIGLALLVSDVATQVKEAGVAQAQDIHKTLTESLASPQTTADLQQKLAGIDEGIRKLKADPVAAALITGPTIAELEKMRAEVVAALQAPNNRNRSGSPDDRDRWTGVKRTLRRYTNSEENRAGVDWSEIEKGQKETSRKVDRTTTAVEKARSAIQWGKRATDQARTAIVASGRTGDREIVAAIRQTRPIINVRVALTSNTIRVSSGGTVTGRNINPNYLKAGLG